jgi:Mitochondrial carrier protein
VVPSLSAGVLAAFIGQTVAYPLETISRRMQVRRSSVWLHSDAISVKSAQDHASENPDAADSFCMCRGAENQRLCLILN